MRTYNIIEKLRRLDALVLDVDGVLTGGKLEYFDDGGQGKAFDVRDGLGIAALSAFGVRIAIITGKSSSLVEKRAGELGVVDLYQGQPNKVPALRKFLEKHNLDNKAVGFVGDDIIDLPAMDFCGFSACPKDAVAAVRRVADWTTRAPSGGGCLREIAEMIIAAKSGKFPPDEAFAVWVRSLENR